MWRGARAASARVRVRVRVRVRARVRVKVRVRVNMFIKDGYINTSTIPTTMFEGANCGQ